MSRAAELRFRLRRAARGPILGQCRALNSR